MERVQDKGGEGVKDEEGEGVWDKGGEGVKEEEGV